MMPYGPTPLQAALRLGYIKFLDADPSSWERNKVEFASNQNRSFVELKRSAEQQIAERKLAAGLPPASKVAGGVEVLSKTQRDLVKENMAVGDRIEFCLIGVAEQAIVALQDRLLTIKVGMRAGATGGARVTSFYYQDITGIEINTGLPSFIVYSVFRRKESIPSGKTPKWPPIRRHLAK